MNNSDIESILLANWYIVNCVKNNGVGCPKTNAARKYLTMKINKALVEKSKKSSTKTYSIFGIF
jgi:hypothetical protein